MSGYEQAVLGAMMLDPAGYWMVADKIDADDFTNPHNAEIFEAIAELSKANKPTDAVTMGDKLPGLASYMCGITAAATFSSLRHYADEVRMAGEGRRVTAAGKRISVGGMTFAEAQRELSDVAPRHAGAAKPIKAYMGDALSQMQRRCDADEAITGLPTGLDGLDEKTCGLQPGTLNIIAARPSMGKTALALQIAVRTAVRGKRVAVFELEMTGVQLSERAVSMISGIDFGKIRNPRQMDEADWPKIADAFAKLEKSALIVDESSTQNVESICARVRQLHMQEPLALVVVDHLGLIDLPGKGNPVNETGAVTKALKALAKDLAIPVVLLVQLNRSCEQRADKRPVLSDLRESGRIEEDADVVAMLYRDDYYNENSAHKGYAELFLRKNRDGETGTVPLRARLNIMRFEGCDELPSAKAVTGGKAIDFGGYASRKATGGN
jgi:replicative DNA helicase